LTTNSLKFFAKLVGVMNVKRNYRVF